MIIVCKRPDCSHHTDEWPAFVSGAYKKMFYEEYIFGYYRGATGENGRLDAAIILIERDKLAEGKAEMIRLLETK